MKAGWRRGQRVGPITRRSEVRSLSPLSIILILLLINSKINMFKVIFSLLLLQWLVLLYIYSLF